MNLVQMYSTILCVGVGSLVYGGIEWLCGEFAERRAGRGLLRLVRVEQAISTQEDRAYQRHFGG